jgi:hypothetical protein
MTGKRGKEDRKQNSYSQNSSVLYLKYKECGEGVFDMGETENLRLCRISYARE